MKSELKKDLSTLTTINESTLSKLNDKVLWCINDIVEKSILNKDDTAEINLGLGTLIIKISNEEIKYKFIPSQDLEKSVTNTVVTERNELVSIMEETLVSKITNLYKDFF